MAKIVAKRYAGVMPVYNMEVYGLHNYVTALGSILHNCRYFCISRTLNAVNPASEKKRTFEDMIDDKEENYESFMCGGEPDASYLAS